MQRKAYLLDLPGGLASESDQRRFVSANWTVVAALAWKGYREQGRGALVVPTNQSRKGLDGATAQAYYLAAGVGWPDDVAAVARDYDPEAEFLVVFTKIRPNQGRWQTEGVWSMKRFNVADAFLSDESAGVVEGRILSPPEAYERLRREL